MTDAGPPPRVRVTGPPRRRRTRGGVADIDAGTRLGDVYMRSLLREQLRLALGALVAVGVTIGLLPLAFHLAPGLSEVRLAGIPLGFWLLGVAVYPVLVLVGWLYVRRAERNEADFAEIVSEVER